MKTTKKSIFIHENDKMKSSLLRWWQSMMLPENKLNEKKILAAPSGMKARLKRCDSIDAAMLSDGFRALWFSLPDALTSEPKPTDIECWATIAAALVYVQEVSEMKLAKAAGAKGDGDKSRVSEMRFAQLQNAKTPDEFLRCLRRILQQIKGKVAVVSLAQDIEQWFMEQAHFRPRKADKRICVQWAMDYYQAAAAKTSK